MRKNDLFDSIGNVDDELIAKAQQPVRSRKKVFAAIISVAACAVFACAGVLWMSSQGNRNSAGNIIADSKVNSYVSSSSVTSAEQYIVSEVSESSGQDQTVSKQSGSGSVGASSGAESSHQQLSQGESRESSAAVSHETHRDESGTGGHVSEVTDVSESSGEESCQESSREVSEPDYPLDKEIRVYYVENDTLQTVSLQSSLYSPDVFDTWKSKNHIGDEVEMVNSLYEVGGERITDPHFDMAKAAAPGHEKTLTLVVFISEELENYYTRPDKELLLESLKQTMLSACEYQPDEYRLELWDKWKPIPLTSADIYYAENGKIEKEHLFVDVSSYEFFDAWKQKNHIGDEVDFTAVYEVEGQRFGDPHFSFLYSYDAVSQLEKAAAAEPKKKLTYIVYITDNFAEYYTRFDKELLLKSLELTMLGACEYQPDEYRMELWDISQPLNLTTDESDQEESESNRIDPNDVWYNDQGEILE